MKVSNYNVFSHYEPHDIYLGYNLVSGGMYVFTHKQYCSVMEILESPAGNHEKLQPLKDKLIEARFLIDDSIDEISLLKLRNRTLRYNQHGLAMVIAPTLACNFDCPYCYVDREKIAMSKSSVEKIKRFFEKRIAKSETAEICWTGGEPLLVPGIVEELSNYFANEAGIQNKDISISVVTNGYLLNDEMIDRLKNCGVQRLQITLDGYEDYHNRFRFTLKREKTYNVILENLVKANSKGLNVTLRSNINKDNYKEYSKLLDDLSEKIEDKSRVMFAPCMVRQPQIDANIPACNVFSNQEFSEIEPEILFYAAQKGFKTGTNELGVSSTYCGANSLSMFVIDSYSNILKCWCNLGKSERNKVGHIKDNGDIYYTDIATLCRWTDWDPFEIEECLECKVLPLCLGGCMYYNIMGETEKIDIGCSHRKHNIEDILKNFYLLSLERRENKKK